MYKKMGLTKVSQDCIFHNGGDVPRHNDNITQVDYEFSLLDFQLKNLNSKKHLDIEKERLSICIRDLLLDVPLLINLVITKKITITNITALLVSKLNRVQLGVLLTKKLMRFFIQTSLFNETARSKFKQQIVQLSYGRQFSMDSSFQLSHVLINLIKLYELLDFLTEDIELVTKALKDKNLFKNLYEVEKDFKTKEILWQH